MKRTLLLLTVIFAVLSTEASAQDIWAWTVETSQGGIYEYYVRSETCQQVSDEELVGDVVIVRKDKWGRAEQPRVTEWHFYSSPEVGFTCAVGTKGEERPRSSVKVADSPMAIKIYYIMKENAKGESL